MEDQFRSEALQLAILGMQNLLDAAARQREHIRPHAHQQRVAGNQRDGKPEFERASAARRAVDGQTTAESRHLGVDGVKADTATGDLGRRLAGGEVRPEDQALQLFLGKLTFGRHDAALARRALDRRQVQPGPVVAAAHQDIVAVAQEVHEHLPDRILAGSLPGRSILDAVIDGVAQQVHQWIDDLGEHIAVHQRVAA